MKRNIFTPTDILLPANCEMALWSTVACDQFSADPAYWDEVAKATANVPSTFHMMLPEAWLGQIDNKAASSEINATMAKYLEQGVFQTLENSYIYVERTFTDGIVRKGLVGAVDLSQYDYSEDSMSPVRATEHTVESRLPARVEIRKHAPIEMPHIMLFIDDRMNMVMDCAKKCAANPIYDFDLMCGGGHIVGRPISGTNAAMITALLDELTDETLLEDKYGFSNGAMVYAIGDGNHSLAAAKKCWDEISSTLTPEEQEHHPARYALVELVNIHDDGVSFYPIHRAMFGVNSNDFKKEADQQLFSSRGTPVALVTNQGEFTRYIDAESIGMVIEKVDQFCQEYAKTNSAEVDYIHGDAEAAAFGKKANNVAILLPTMKKEELFTSVMDTGVFCKKSFSIGQATEKRYYLECRRIQNNT